MNIRSRFYWDYKVNSRIRVTLKRVDPSGMLADTNPLLDSDGFIPFRLF